MSAAIIPVLGFSQRIVESLGINSQNMVIVLALWTSIICLLIIFSRYTGKHLEKLGDLSINMDCITKSICGFNSYFQFDQIREINIKKHTRDIFFPSSVDGCKTYLVTISDKEKVEKFIVSSQSLDKPSTNFLDSLKTVERIKKKKLNIT